MRNKLIVLCMSVAALALMACGSSGGDSTPNPGEEGGACKGGLCNTGLVCSEQNICVKEAADGDEADGDNVGECSGSCTGTPATKCINSDADLCVCSSGSWTAVTCQSFCTNKGQVSKGCGMDTERSMDYCLCEEAAVDGDGDTEPPVDGDTEPPVDGDPDTDTDAPTKTATPCEFQVTATDYLNKGAAACPSGTDCMGMYLNGQAQGSTPVECTDDSTCWDALGSMGVCVAGFCGMSFCGVNSACSNDTPCAVVGTDACCYKQTGASTGQCLPSDLCPAKPGAQKPGQPCAFTDDLNKAAGNCEDGGTCLGMLYNGTTQATCANTAECATKYGLTSDLVGCSKSGYCGLSFCSVPAGSDCNAVGGSNPQQGSSTTCDALQYMHSDRWGSACCLMVSNQKLCAPAQVCDQEGTAAAGEACKDPGEQINTAADFCQSGLYCLGLTATGSTCQNKSDCASVDSERADCVGGVCKLSYCALLECTKDGDCPTSAYGTGACCTTELFSDGTAVCGIASICQ